jgi:PKD repeat protein
MKDVKVNYLTVGEYDVSMIAYSKYGIDTLTKKNLIIVSGIPIADFYFEIKNDSVLFIDLSQNAVNYYWKFGDGNTSRDDNPIYIYSQNGSFKVELTVNNICGRSDLSKEVIISSVATNELDELDYFIYPNPNSGNFYLGFAKEVGVIEKVSIRDVLGNIILTESGSTLNHVENRIIFNMKNIDRGIYFLEIEARGYKVEKKILLL